ncbi:hypothetical protein CFP56_028056 [Quercus suber]|uniref:Uncharacterized protein n=1 Tax=Quercus suber TaxID=58331 RepID=A0AAW0JVC1_QUESU
MRSLEPVQKFSCENATVTSKLHLLHQLPRMVLRLHLPRQLVEPTRRLQHLLQHSLSYPMIHHLEEPHVLCSPPDTVNGISTPASEVYDRNCEMDVGWFAGIGVVGGEILRWADENSGDFGDTSIHQTFDTRLGIVKCLQLLETVIVCGISGRSEIELKISPRLLSRRRYSSETAGGCKVKNEVN